MTLGIGLDLERIIISLEQKGRLGVEVKRRESL